MVTLEGGMRVEMISERDYSVVLTVTIAAKSATFATFTAPYSVYTSVRRATPAGATVAIAYSRIISAWWYKSRCNQCLSLTCAQSLRWQALVLYNTIGTIAPADFVFLT